MGPVRVQAKSGGDSLYDPGAPGSYRVAGVLPMAARTGCTHAAVMNPEPGLTLSSITETVGRSTRQLFEQTTLLSMFGGMLTLLWWPRLELTLLLALAVSGLAFLFSAITRRIGVVLLAAAWAAATGYAHIHAIDARYWQQSLQVRADIISIPQHQPEVSRLRLQVQQPPALRGKQLAANWFRPALPPQALPSAGEQWSFTLRLRPLNGMVNRYGFDYPRWLLGNGVHATASIVAGHRVLTDDKPVRSSWRADIAAVRGQQADWISGVLPLAQAALARALLVGDRSQLSAASKDLLAATGTSHLLAISGLHVGLVALLGSMAVRILSGLLLLLPVPAVQRHLQVLRWPQLAAAGGLLLAVMYALLSGFMVSTQRAMIMLLIAALALLGRRQQWSGRSLLLAAVLIVASNPLQLLNAGFWLSFMAVFSLWLVFAHRHHRRGKLHILVLAQLTLSATMLMVQLALLQQFSLLMLPVNLLAVPVLSLIIMPCLLLALCLHLLGLDLANACLSAGGQLLQWLIGMLQLVEHGSPLAGGWLLRIAIDHPGWLLPAMLGGLWLVMPRGLPLRWLGLCLWLPVLWPNRPMLPDGAWQAEVLDVGQGTAVLVRTARHALVYDSGPGDNHGRDRLGDSLLPLLRSWRLDAERIVISHGDLDHAGGLYTLRQRWPQALIYSSDPQLGPGCATGQHWRWDGVDFTMLHPGRHLPYSRNNSSCVLLVTSVAGSMLLPGDIDDKIERRLLWQWQGPGADVLLVPHHGSSHSSSHAWLTAVAPQFAVVTTGQWNRFAFPKADVMARYRRAGIPLLDTAACGAISIHADIDGAGIRVHSRRRQRPRWWQNVDERDCDLPESATTAVKSGPNRP